MRSSTRRLSASSSIDDPLLQKELLEPSRADEILDEAPPSSSSSQGSWLLICAALLLISSVGNSIFNKKMTNHMQNYPYFLSQLTTAVYVPIFGFVVWYTRTFTNTITPEMDAFPKKKFFVMGVFDALSGVCALFGGVYTSGNTQGLLTQAAVPITMILSYIVLRQRYRILQIGGAVVILCGVVLVLLPKFLNSNHSDEDKPLFNIIFLLSVVPMALSSIYKEIAFGSAELDVNFVQFWVAVWQLVFGFLLIPLNTLSFLGPNSVPWSQLPSALGNGLKCLGGIDTIVTACGGADPQPPCDMCSGAFVPVVFYLIFNCAFNVFIMLVVKHGSAALFYVIMTLRLPLVNLAFSWSLIQNPPEPFSNYTIGGLVIIIAGLVAYRVGSAQAETNENKVSVEKLPEQEMHTDSL